MMSSQPQNLYDYFVDYVSPRLEGEKVVEDAINSFVQKIYREFKVSEGITNRSLIPIGKMFNTYNELQHRFLGSINEHTVDVFFAFLSVKKIARNPIDYYGLAEEDIKHGHGKILQHIIGAGILDLFKRLKRGFNNTSKATIKEFGDLPITHMQVNRTAIFTAMKKVMKKLTGYDKLFHLGIVCTVENNGFKRQFTIEKQQQVNITKQVSTNEYTESIDVPLKGVTTLNDLLKNLLSKNTKDDIFIYDAVKRNCQDFIMKLLESNDLSNEGIKSFVKQDVTHLEHQYGLRNVLNTLTDTASRVQQTIGHGKCITCGRE